MPWNGENSPCWEGNPGTVTEGEAMVADVVIADPRTWKRDGKSEADRVCHDLAGLAEMFGRIEHGDRVPLDSLRHAAEAMNAAHDLILDLQTEAEGR